MQLNKATEETIISISSLKVQNTLCIFFDIQNYGTDGVVKYNLIEI